MESRFKFEQLREAPLIVDAIYEGGLQKNMGSEPLSKLLGVGNSGGFRPRKRKDKKKTRVGYAGDYAFLVLYTTMQELEWPDHLDVETGVFRYYGDNRQPGKDILDTRNHGNEILESVFDMLHIGVDFQDIPPFLVFQKVGTGRDVKFLGLAVPGNPDISGDNDLIAFWRSMDEKRFQNYEAYFTILDAKQIDKRWLQALIEDHDNSLEYAPKAWVEFMKYGRRAVRALKAKKINTIPSRYDQMQMNEDERICLKKIRDHYRENPHGFEMCAVDLIRKMDPHLKNFILTQKYRDGGYDAKGSYVIQGVSHKNRALSLECCIEAKCYDEKNSVGVRSMSRLISRIRSQQFGVLVTTSYVHQQAYEEVVDDGHKVLIITAADVAQILKENAIDSSNVDSWLERLDAIDTRA